MKNDWLNQTSADFKLLQTTVVLTKLVSRIDYSDNLVISDGTIRCPDLGRNIALGHC